MARYSRQLKVGSYFGVIACLVFGIGSAENTQGPPDIEVYCGRLDSLPAGSSTVPFLSGEDVLLMCRAISGEDIKDVTWSKDGYHLNVTDCPPVTTSHCTIKGGKLLLKNANSTDSARYRCHTKKSSGPLSVEVNDWTNKTVILPPWNQTAQQQSNASIVFVVSKNVDIYAFYKDDQLIKMGPARRFQNTMDGQLHIDNVSQDDAGKYALRVKNLETQQTAEASLDFTVYSMGISRQRNNTKPTSIIPKYASSHRIETPSTLLPHQYVLSPNHTTGHTATKQADGTVILNNKFDLLDEAITSTTGKDFGHVANSNTFLYWNEESTKRGLEIISRTFTI
ncbi:roundabout homolog 1-like isoform X2 [Corticium candelabrum]|uniref:roundabout homolog 1-like isoform X2 n=1 Tax=Corticium candelabrum TaxID=121492 RepID=UPI002E2663ED|nr:roundabout homolog 1-like isoform X2 [Corticium candelabrum]